MLHGMGESGADKAFLPARPLGLRPLAGDALALAAAWFAGGIFLWFGLPGPPPVWMALAGGLAAALAWWRWRWPALLAALMVLAGLFWVGLRIQVQDTPLLPANAGRVLLTGQVESMRPHRPGRARMVLGVREIRGVRAQYWPRRVRLNVSLKGAKTADLPLPGDVVRLRAVLLRLPRPQEPGAYDPGRDLYMAGIGATGFARVRDVTVVSAACAGCGPWLALMRQVERLRRGIAARVRTGMADERAAGLALALITGERGALPERVRENLRAAGLAHILAISGLHLALVAGAVFWLVRAGLAVVPALALRRPVKKIAALAAWLVALAYLLLSGNSVATQRAFIMLSVALLALLLDRPAISMRNLAVAAWIIMLLHPHKVVSAGFQLSFLAVAGLVAAYEWFTWRRRRRAGERGAPVAAHGRLSRWPFAFAGGLLATTVIASVYTALPAAWHFHRLPAHGLLGNLAALPVLSAMVMPAGLLALAAMPFGLEGPVLAVMERGLAFMLAAAERIAALPGTWWRVAQMQPVAAALIGGGLLWLALRRDGWRLLGVLAVVAGAAWPPAQRPDVLVEERARLVAVRTPAGLAAMPGRAGQFALRVWLERDGDAADAKTARARPGWRCDALMCRVRVNGRVVLYLKDVFRRKGGKGAEAEVALPAMQLACDGAVVVVAAFPLRGLCREEKGRVALDRFDVWRNGAHALFLRRDGGVEVRHVRGVSSGRPWAAAPLARYRVLSARRVNGRSSESGNPSSACAASTPPGGGC